MKVVIILRETRDGVAVKEDMVGIAKDITRNLVQVEIELLDSRTWFVRFAVGIKRRVIVIV